MKPGACLSADHEALSQTERDRLDVATRVLLELIRRPEATCETEAERGAMVHVAVDFASQLVGQLATPRPRRVCEEVDHPEVRRRREELVGPLVQIVDIIKTHMGHHLPIEATRWDGMVREIAATVAVTTARSWPSRVSPCEALATQIAYAFYGAADRVLPSEWDPMLGAIAHVIDRIPYARASP